MKKFKLPKKVKAAWVKALRSGKYKQGANSLKYEYDNETYFCCLGVAKECKLAKPMQERDGFSEWESEEWVSEKFLPKPIQVRLATFNDGSSGSCKVRSFNWIAGYIERYL